ncbi:Lactonase, 7-bladed beta-propeller-domain-containing protein [Microdochium trichocladiopsis]|uniref:Lactonase, 7-bladed beta-propeller-domain-containing protein n=1 Tax=Microdochium trichocladiopsis TaxID=1682393 RepID=A0A9P8Y5R5_9PEZI|nr:Lactonase, 7-bladed beta-propeller-domain-containing protein [Microdochium trichocladiopsis]KAH7029825.1 Lactonase, 7-bladed beta-propeller-domain-containing protein [Microdochium trichocladiopsis]
MAPPMRFFSLLLAIPASADILFATSYNDHTVTSLRLEGSTLSVVGKNLDCGSEPTWLTLDKTKSRLYCLNEGWGGNASLTSYQTRADGKLTTLDILPVLKSPVSSTLWGANNERLAVAHYDTSTFSSYDVSNAKDLRLTKSETYTLAAPGPVPDRQEAPHLHDAILDPTRKFLVSPDLGADLLRLYRITGNSWTAITPAKAVPGSGPRHGGFAVHGPNTYFYTVNELSNTITGYKVTYSGSSISFAQILNFSTHGPGGSVPAGTSSAELEISPDQRFVLISSRNEASLTIPAFDGSATTIPSDPIISFAINPASGQLTLTQIAPAGGLNPRGFSLNKAGTLVASALQNDNRVVVYKRDVKTGKLGAVVASATVGEGANNGPNYVLFNDC